MNARSSRSRARHDARGYTLIELLVAMVVALFLLAGLLTIVQSMRQTFNEQNALAQLQDGERLAMVLMGDVVQAAGYFPSPTTNSLSSVYPAGAGFAGGQAISGTSATGGPTGNSDSVSVRFTPPTSVAGDANANTNLSMTNCTGGTDAAGVVYTDTFSVDANGNLDCTLSINGAAQPIVQLVSGVQRLQIWYGVPTSAASGDNVDTYYTAANMPVSDWPNVTAVKIRLTFINPLACPTAEVACLASTSPAISYYLERVVGVMSRTGVTT